MDMNDVKQMSPEQLKSDLANGAKFIVFEYVISVIFVTFRRSSKTYLFRPGEDRLVKSIPYMLLTFFFGWWGIPWGPIYSIASFITNFSGGRDVTAEVLTRASAQAKVEKLKNNQQ
ncbi:hypothetical protein JW887_01815 [Candidatus Dojkabacteria bacterium]|nr:hypothetical protein [Candidatus Dojkabacteria bacterium]